MLRRVPRALRRAVIVAVLLAVGASIAQSWMSGTPGTAGYVQTTWGPLGPADRDLLVKVRLAGLWEGPSGQQAEQQAGRAEVQEVGVNIHHEHAELDALTRSTADQLGVLLPSRPSTEQLSWMNEMSELTGTEYDRVFVQRLRAAHGAVLPVIAEVRAGTRNELMRTFAATADEYVSRHIGYLEATGIVDYADLPEPASPGFLSVERRPIDLIVPGIVVLAALLAAAALVAALRRPGPQARRPGRDDGTRTFAPVPLPARRPARFPDPHIPDSRIPDSRIPEARFPEPHIPEPRISETGPRHAVRH